ncbi:serine-rich 25 kDa antigen protein-like [Palaemon carinicauda]|uniref:serine-rich 25 kDa antigen protein-like n=1 Tax=Palaemon carinicauda TaxID=392227 RepID=UPI0035B61146
MVSSQNPSPRRKRKFEASRPTKRRWNHDELSRSPSPGSSSYEPCPSEDDLDLMPVMRTKSRSPSQDRAAEDPSPSTSVIRQPSPSRPQDPAVVVKSFMSVMQEKLFLLVQAFSRPHAQSSPKEPLRSSSKPRHSSASSSARRQDDSASRSRCQDDSASRSRCQDDTASLSRRQDDDSMLPQDDTASCYQDDSSSRRKDASPSHHQDASPSHREDSSSYCTKDSSSARRKDAASSRRQDASGSRGQAACSPLLQDESFDLPLSDSREPSSQTKDVVEVDQDLEVVSDEEDKPADAAGDYKVLSRSSLNLMGRSSNLLLRDLLNLN